MSLEKIHHTTRTWSWSLRWNQLSCLNPARLGRGRSSRIQKDAHAKNIHDSARRNKRKREKNASNDGGCRIDSKGCQGATSDDKKQQRILTKIYVPTFLPIHLLDAWARTKSYASVCIFKRIVLLQALFWRLGIPLGSRLVTIRESQAAQRRNNSYECRMVILTRSANSYETVNNQGHQRPNKECSFKPTSVACRLKIQAIPVYSILNAARSSLTKFKITNKSQSDKRGIWKGRRNAGSTCGVGARYDSSSSRTGSLEAENAPAVTSFAAAESARRVGSQVNRLPFSCRVGRPRRHSRPPRPPRTPIAHGGRAGQTSGGGGNRQSVPLVMVKRPDLGGRAFAWHPFVSGVAVRFSFSAFFRF
ncbi:unnamed protein product [Nesidiocoris tenuis]|uniref:Uncharacterized protein n=1 Tax=Nesidiocoris tenuis TaxID=355587 RepID=A0A6H5G6J3_9HEMI|nr:unnamed protein product [Nesidiocoris tenuis]